MYVFRRHNYKTQNRLKNYKKILVIRSVAALRQH